MNLENCSLSQSGAISKGQFIKVWESLTPAAHVRPEYISYGHSGTTIDQDGIRITGSLQFIESVISRLNDLLVFENSAATRLSIACSELKDKNTGEPMPGRFRCAIQVRERGTGDLPILERAKRQKMAELYPQALGSSIKSA